MLRQLVFLVESLATCVADVILGSVVKTDVLPQFRLIGKHLSSIQTEQKRLEFGKGSENPKESTNQSMRIVSVGNWKENNHVQNNKMYSAYLSTRLRRRPSAITLLQRWHDRSSWTTLVDTAGVFFACAALK